MILDHCLGGDNLKMVALARQHGAAAKFSGSGGAIVGLLLDQSKKAKLVESFQQAGFVYVDIVPNAPSDEEIELEQISDFSLQSASTDQSEIGTTL